MMAGVTTTVAVFGSCNMDLVAYVGTAPRLGETVLGREFHTIPGGKGANQAIAAARAGADVRMIGAVGADDLGSQIRDNLHTCGVNTRGLRTVPGRSGTAHIVVDDHGGNSIVVVPSANGTVTDLAPGDEELIAGSRSLLLQLEIPLEGVQAAAAAARRCGVPVVLTPAPAAELPAEILSHVDLLVPNEHEAAVLAGRDDPRHALSELLELVPEVVITMGSRGALYGNHAGEVVEVPAHRVKAVDTTAAGDTFVGVLSVAIGEGIAKPDALRMASAASALSVQRAGASNSMPTRQEIKDFLSDHHDYA
jgi:ribokinase